MRQAILAVITLGMILVLVYKVFFRTWQEDRQARIKQEIGEAEAISEISGGIKSARRLD